MVLITHKLREIMAMTDDVSVMRRGRMVAHGRPLPQPRGAGGAMVGRKVLLQMEKAPARPREPVLEVRHIEVRDDQGVARVKDVALLPASTSRTASTGRCRAALQQRNVLHARVLVLEG